MRLLNKVLMAVAGLALLGLVLVIGWNGLVVVLIQFCGWLASRQVGWAPAAMEWLLPLQPRGAYELAGLLAALAAGCALGRTQEKHDHVVVDIFTGKFPASWNRHLDRGKYLVKLAFAGMLAWQVFAWGLRIQRSHELSENLKLPYYPVVYAVAAGFAVLALTVLVDLLAAMRGPAPRTGAGSPPSAAGKAATPAAQTQPELQPVGGERFSEQDK